MSTWLPVFWGASVLLLGFLFRLAPGTYVHLQGLLSLLLLPLVGVGVTSALLALNAYWLEAPAKKEGGSDSIVSVLKLTFYALIFILALYWTLSLLVQRYPLPTGKIENIARFRLFQAWKNAELLGKIAILALFGETAWLWSITQPLAVEAGAKSGGLKVVAKIGFIALGLALSVAIYFAMAMFSFRT